MATQGDDLAGAAKMSREIAILVAPFTESQQAQLEELHPRRLQLVGDWSDLTRLSRIAGDVESLELLGDISRGTIRAAVGIELFTAVASLRIASVVREGYDASGLLALKELDVPWQDDAAAAFLHPNLSSLTIRGYSGEDFEASLVCPQTRLRKLWLSAPKKVHR